MKVRVTAPARADRLSAVNYLRARSPGAAAATNQAIRAALASLGHLPERGRRSVVKGARELVLRDAPYVIVYRVEPDVVTVLRIRHASQDPSP